MVIATGTLLLSLPIASQSGQPVAVIDALFTATSATAVTGLVTVDTQTTYSLFGELVILTLIQTGGLGFMTLSTLVALLLGKRITLKERLVMQEAMNQLTVEGVVRLSKYVLIFTLFAEGLGALLLSIRFSSQMPLGQAIYFGIFHAVSAFCNAGFDLFSRSLVDYRGDLLVNMVITLLIIFGGLGFSVVADIYTKRSWQRLSLHSKIVIRTTLLLIVTATVIIFLLEYTNTKSLAPLPLGEKILASYFQAVTPRTAGFNTLVIGDLRPVTLLFITILMFIGASPGSTGGGIKTTTFAAIAVAVWTIIRGNVDIEVFGRRLPRGTVLKALAIAAVSLLLIVTVTGILLITEQADLQMVLFEVTSAFGTVGLSMGLTPKLTVAGKLLITATMFTGRVGPLTLAFAIAQRLGRQGIKHYPEERIIVG
ncbi:MAG: trk/ktr system potassium uptake protein [Moorella sp. (in: firmicutes)]|uniref:TrkH family potassium uptake protein n=1 Tax=Moorella sp. E308F TaxID=2572682 RepID=UPI0010FFBEC0|nr:TrkH family potassium uptake protein [Moorella sp. E308F]MDK2816466.1 trk/ktr system potassium uptake protein [Moorella sp. (in: firmicutes)]MDK2895280.1 trk/ktr system potassium uptake protein [Moorella sp. (in: firmicutes)]GEA16176.1 K+ transporter Trk [Moorella sp. E308F]